MGEMQESFTQVSCHPLCLVTTARPDLERRASRVSFGF